MRAKINTKYVKKGLAISAAVVLPVNIGLAVTLFAIHSKEQRKVETVYNNLLKSEDLFRFYSPYYEVSKEQIQEIRDEVQKAKQAWNNSEITLDSKLEIIDLTQQKIFNFYITNDQKSNFEKEQNVPKFWKLILDNQQERVRELDLNEQLREIRKISLDQFLENVNSSKEDKIASLEHFADEITKKVTDQNQKLNIYIDSLKQSAQNMNVYEYQGFKDSLEESMSSVYSKIINLKFRLNEVQIADQKLQLKDKNLKSQWDSSQNLVNQSNEYLQEIDKIYNSADTDSRTKDEIVKFLNKYNIDQTQTSSKTDIENLSNSVLNFYQLLSDKQKSISQLKEVVINLKDYINKFSDVFLSKKTDLISLIDKTNVINDKTDLIVAKNDLFNKYYNLKLANNVYQNLQQTYDKMQLEKLISQGKRNQLNSDLEVLITSTNSYEELLNKLKVKEQYTTNEYNSALFYNSQLNLLEEQSLFLINSPYTNEDIKNQIALINSEVSKTYITDTNSTYIAAVANKLNEKFRIILKDELKDLVIQANNQIELLKDAKYPNNDATVAYLENLNKDSNIFVKDFNPITSVELIEHIKKYHFGLKTSKDAIAQSNAENVAKVADKYLNSLFDDNNPETDFTKNEKDRIAAYDATKNRLAELRQQINNGTQDQNIANEIADLNAKLNKMIETGPAFAELSQKDKEGEELSNKLKASPYANALKPYTDKIDNLRNSLNDLFKNPNATPEEVEQAKKQLEQAIEEAKNANIRAILDERLNKLKAQIDSTYGDDKSSPGAQALLKQYEDMKNRANSFLDDDEIDALANKIDRVTSIVQTMFDLEKEKAQLRNVVSQYTDQEYTSRLTKNAFELADKEIKNADSLIEAMNDGSNIPNLIAYENEKEFLIQRAKEIEIAYYQDKITILNDEIQQNVQKNPKSQSALNFNTSLTRVNNYATVKKDSLALEELKESGRFFEKERDLANSINELMVLFNTYNNDDYQLIARYLANIIGESDLSVDDSLEEIDRKLAKVKEAKAIAVAKKDYLDIFNSYKNELEENKNWKIYQSIAELNSSIQEQKNETLYNDTLTLEQVNAHKEKLIADFQEFKSKKDKLTEDFNAEIQKTEDLVVQLDDAYANLRNADSNANFSRYYEKSKNAFIDDKNLNRRNFVGFEEIQKHQDTLKLAYEKELALYELNKLYNFTKSSSFGSTDKHQNIKDWTSSFKDSILAELDNDETDLDRVKALREKITQNTTLVSLQRDTAGLIDTLQNNQNNSTLQQESISRLNDALSASEPSADNDYNNLVQLKHDLQVVYDQEVTVQILRDQINRKINENEIGLKSTLATKFAAKPAGVDENATGIIHAALDKIIADAQAATTKEQLFPLRDRVNFLQENQDNIATLANTASIGISEVEKSSENNFVSSKQYSKDVQDLVAQARNLYAQATQSQEYTQLNEKLEIVIEKLKQANILSQIVSDIRTLINGSETSVVEPISFYTYNGTDGASKKNSLTEYINLIETTSNIESVDSQTVETLKQLNKKATKIKELVTKQSEISHKISQLRNQGYVGNLTDANQLTKLLWDSVPVQEVDSDTKLGKQSNNTYTVSDLYNLNSSTWDQTYEKLIAEFDQIKQHWITVNEFRIETNEIFELIQNSEFDNSQSVLQVRLSALVSSLQEQNNTSVEYQQNGHLELNQLRDKAYIIQRHLTDLKTLASNVYKLDNLLTTIFSEDSVVVNEINEAKELINKALEYYDNTEKIALEDENSVVKVSEAVNNKYFRIRFLTNYIRVKNRFDNNKTLTESERAVIQRIFDSLIAEFNDPNAELEPLYNKYFREPNGLSLNERNTLIDYVLTNAINLRAEINDSENYLKLQDSLIDSEEVTRIFDELQNLLNTENNGSKVINSRTENNEDEKLAEIVKLHNKIESLIAAKKAQLPVQLQEGNSIKTFINEKLDFLKQNDNDTVDTIYVQDFIHFAIDEIQDGINNSASLNFADTNNKLIEAKAIVNSQIFRLYSILRNKVSEIKLLVDDYVADFGVLNTQARRGANINTTTYANLLNAKNIIDDSLASDFSTSQDFAVKLNKLIDALQAQGKERVNSLVNEVKVEFDAKLATAQDPANTNLTKDSDGVPQFSAENGFHTKMVKLNTLLDQIIQNKTENVYDYNDIEILKNLFDSYKTQYDLLADEYTRVKDSNDSTTLSSFAVRLDALNNQFYEYQAKVKEVILALIEYNPLKEVFADVYSTIRFETQSEYTQELKTQYATFVDAYRAKINNLISRTADSFTPQNWNKTSDLSKYVYLVIENATSFKDWMNDPEKKKLLFTQLEKNPSLNNPLPSTLGQKNTPFEHKYQVIITEKDVTREKFSEFFQTIQPKDNSDKLLISNNDNFLSQFTQFAFTKKDVTNVDQIGSIFSNSTVKVYLKKYDENGWFKYIAPTRDDLDRKTLKAKIVYKYESPNSIIGEYEIEKEVDITFNTLDRISLVSGSSDIFYDRNNNIGYAARQEVFNVDEAGWLVPDYRTGMTQPEETKIKNDVIKKAYNKFKEAILDLDSTNSYYFNSGNNPRNGTIQPTGNWTKPENVSDIGYRTSALIDNHPDRENDRYNFGFLNQTALSFTYNVILNGDSSIEKVRAWGDDNLKELIFLQMIPGRFAGHPTNGEWGAPTNTPIWYDNRVHGEYRITNSSGWWNSNEFGSGISFNQYRFGFDYDVRTKKLYIFNTWLENVLYSPIQLAVSNLAPRTLVNKVGVVANNNQYTAEDRQWARDLGTRARAAGSTYRFSPEELIKFYSLVSASGNAEGPGGVVFNAPVGAYRFNLFPVGSSNSVGASPLWPVNGGQAPISRTNFNDLKSARLTPVPATDYVANNKTQLIKSSARQTLYAATIDKFWFKIRKDS